LFLSNFSCTESTCQVLPEGWQLSGKGVFWSLGGTIVQCKANLLPMMFVESEIIVAHAHTHRSIDVLKDKDISTTFGSRHGVRELRNSPDPCSRCLIIVICNPRHVPTSLRWHIDSMREKSICGMAVDSSGVRRHCAPFVVPLLRSRA